MFRISGPHHKAKHWIHCKCYMECHFSLFRQECAVPFFCFFRSADEFLKEKTCLLLLWDGLLLTLHTLVFLIYLKSFNFKEDLDLLLKSAVNVQLKARWKYWAQTEPTYTLDLSQSFFVKANDLISACGWDFEGTLLKQL